MRRCVGVRRCVGAWRGALPSLCRARTLPTRARTLLALCPRSARADESRRSRSARHWRFAALPPPLPPARASCSVPAACGMHAGDAVARGERQGNDCCAHATSRLSPDTRLGLTWAHPPLSLHLAYMMAADSTRSGGLAGRREQLGLESEVLSYVN